MGACSHPYSGVVDAFVVEARAWEWTFILAIKIGFRKIVIERDSLSVIKKLKALEDDRSVLRSFIHNIHFLKKKKVEEISYRFVWR